MAESTEFLKRKYNQMAKNADKCRDCRQKKKHLAQKLESRGVKVPKTYFRTGRK